jgi:hexosaminidase
MLEYSALPKLLGFAERAWSKAPAYETFEHTPSRIGAIDQAWNIFVNQVGQFELPRLDHIFGGFNYRIAPPGAVIEKGKLYANTDFPGLIIRYTTDGSEPSETSPVYQGPVAITGTTKLKAFNGAGRGSRTVEVSM